MNVLDGVLALAAVMAVLVGWRLGLVCGIVSLLAVLLGGAAGMALGSWAAPLVTGEPTQQTLLRMCCTVLGITAAQLASMRLAQRVGAAVDGTRLRVLNSAGGAVLTLGFAVAVVWVLATALTLAPSAQLATVMRGSAVLAGMDRTTPADAGPLLQQLEVSAGGYRSARVFTGLGLLPAPPVDPPPPGEVAPPARRAAGASVVRITGHAECGRTLTGSGVVVAEDLVVTNAHVVAGVPAPVVFPKEQRIGVPADLVYFDPAADIAVLRTSGLGLPPVEVSATAAGTGDLVTVAGYPAGGPQSVQAARVRGPVTATGTDIYGTSEARRRVLVIAGEVRPGTSGGALLDQEGRLLGVVFAAGGEPGDSTGYVLAAEEVAAVVAGASSYVPIGAGSCVPDAPQG